MIWKVQSLWFLREYDPPFYQTMSFSISPTNLWVFLAIIARDPPIILINPPFNLLIIMVWNEVGRDILSSCYLIIYTGLTKQQRNIFIFMLLF